MVREPSIDRRVNSFGRHFLKFRFVVHHRKVERAAQRENGRRYSLLWLRTRRIDSKNSVHHQTREIRAPLQVHVSRITETRLAPTTVHKASTTSSEANCNSPSRRDDIFLSAYPDPPLFTLAFRKVRGPFALEEALLLPRNIRQVHRCLWHGGDVHHCAKTEVRNPIRPQSLPNENHKWDEGSHQLNRPYQYGRVRPRGQHHSAKRLRHQGTLSE